jgi:glyoxylase-like metal-dependent hydrolase (beta-lactamase superfamily II)
MLQVREYGPVVAFRAARSFLGYGYYFTAAYWVDGLLIDTTCAFTAQQLFQALPQDSRPVRQIVNTHCHEDHIGCNGLLQRTYAASIQAHPLTLPILANPRLQSLQLYRRVFWGWPEPSHGEPIGEWVETPHYRFQVIHTPGHSPDHICLYEPEQGWLFSADTYIGGQDRAARPDYDIYAIIASLKKLAALRLTALFPGSGTVRVNNPATDIRNKIAYLEDLGARVHELHNQGHSVPAIKKRLLGPETNIYYMTLGHFQERYLIEAYLRQPAADPNVLSRSATASRHQLGGAATASRHQLGGSGEGRGAA